MKQETRKAVLCVSLAVAVAACSERSSTGVAVHALQSPALTVDPPSSAGFYKDPSDGKWWWDGTPPPQDLTPSVITETMAWAKAPRHVQEWPKVAARHKIFDADEWKIDISYDFKIQGVLFAQGTSSGNYAM